jgi:hypothetical protein
MPKIGLKTKLVLLLVTGLASVGVNLGGSVSKAACGNCVQLWQGGRLVGYGCLSGGSVGCVAASNSCTYIYSERCS